MHQDAIFLLEKKTISVLYILLFVSHQLMNSFQQYDI
jgi:hypothetical protein